MAFSGVRISPRINENGPRERVPPPSINNNNESPTIIHRVTAAMFTRVSNLGDTTYLEVIVVVIVPGRVICSAAWRMVGNKK